MLYNLYLQKIRSLKAKYLEKKISQTKSYLFAIFNASMIIDNSNK